MNVHHGVKWSFLAEIAAKAVQPLVFVVLARLLTPEDYGVMAAAGMVLGFSAIFWDAGMGKAIVQYRGDRAPAANAAFWINTGLGIVVAGTLVSVSGYVAEKVFHDPRVAPVLKVMALQVLLSASVSVHNALLKKDLKFKHLFWVRVATIAVPGLISIPMAWCGMGYWSLVAGMLAGQILQVLILWKTSPWKPQASIDLGIAMKLGQFGAWVAVAGLLTWFYAWADSLILGMWLGSHELGLYRTGNAFVMIMFGFLFGPLMPVLYSHFSRIQDDRGRVKATLLKVSRIITFVSVPLALLLLGNSSFISNLVFGEKWKGIELVVAVLALIHGYGHIVVANGEAFRAVGAPAYETKIMAITLSFYVVGFVLSVQHGLGPFVWTRLGLSVAASSVHLWALKKVLGLHVSPIVAYAIRISLACLPAVLISLSLRSATSAIQGAVTLVGTALLTALVLWVLERRGLIPDILAVVKSIRNKSGVATGVYPT